jgi:DNA-binding response OmpR family regulator
MADMTGKILVVDDDPTIRDVLKAVFGKAGLEVVTAEDGRAGLAAFGEGGFDLVITDIKMPVLSGIGMIERLRRSDPDVPVIIITAVPDLKSARDALRYKVFDYIIKPFPALASVEAIVRKALKARAESAGAEEIRRELEELDAAFAKWKAEAEEEIQSLKKHATGLRSLAKEHVGGIASLIDNLQYGIAITDPHGTITTLNRGLLKIMGVTSPAGGVGQVLDRLPGDSSLREAMMSSRDKCLYGNPAEVMAEASRDDGKPSQYLIDTRRLSDESGELIGFATIVRPARRLVSRRAKFE